MSHRGRVAKRNDVSKNRWRYEFDSLDPATGKRRKVTKGGFRTMAEAQAAVDRIVRDQEQGRLPSRPLKLGEWLTSEWLRAITPALEPTTALQYRAVVRA
ncbi:MAG: Arm DNA-binding domain-containing protein [Actinobacteria bacterium]|nr:Arm DNA-binding domain-containing protein [Actinomycetota bacterium]